MFFRRKKLIFLILILFIGLCIWFLTQEKIYDKKDLSYGVTFSQKEANDLGLDWKNLYINILDDLQVKKIRLPVYWDLIEKEKGVYDWEDINWQVEEGQKRNAQLILALGERVPRWPECHQPEWAKKMDKKEKQKKIIDFLDTAVRQFKGQNNIFAWQVENEPFLKYFGECDALDVDFLDQEIASVRAIDDRPIIVTDSGELSMWVPAASRADIFGTSMYKRTYSQHFKTYINYPITPAFFRAKKNIISMFADPKQWIVIELQAEPWCKIPFQSASLAERSETMDVEKFKEMLDFSSQTGFKEFYLWGVEWWYWEKTTQGNGQYWEIAKGLFQK
jgi:hypothetical protein